MLTVVGRARVLLPLALICLTAACGVRRLELPTDSGRPLPDYEAIHRELSAACRGVNTLTTELSLSGRAREQRLGGTLHAGFRVPASMRLELRVPPFNTLGFVLAADGASTTLLLPRTDEAVRGTRADEILGALTGITLSPADLMAILTGCVVPAPRPTAGRVHAGGVASLNLEGPATLYLESTRDGWRLRAARRGDWRIDYLDWPESGRYPSRLELTASSPLAVKLTARLAQTEVNVPIPDAAFAVTVPAGADLITIEELRQAGPLRDGAP